MKARERNQDDLNVKSQLKKSAGNQDRIVHLQPGSFTNIDTRKRLKWGHLTNLLSFDSKIGLFPQHKITQ